MIPPSSSKFRFQRFLDAIASRLGIYSAIGVLILICVGMGTYLQSVVIELDKSLVEFEDQQVRNGYVAMSDVQRLVLVAHQAVNAGVMSKPLATEFRTAADILYVRANHFRQLSEGKEGGSEAESRSLAAAVARHLLQGEILSQRNSFQVRANYVSLNKTFM